MVATKKAKGIEQTNKARGAAIKRFRKLRKVKAKTLAASARLDLETLRRIEAGDEEIRPKTLERIAKKLKLPASFLDLLGYEVGDKKETLEGQILMNLQEVVIKSVKLGTTKAK